MAVEVKKCNCSGSLAAKFQDKEYGQGMRVMNQTLKKEYNCTVCGAKHK